MQRCLLHSLQVCLCSCLCPACPSCNSCFWQQNLHQRVRGGAVVTVALSVTVKGTKSGKLLPRRVPARSRRLRELCCCSRPWLKSVSDRLAVLLGKGTGHCMPLLQAQTCLRSALMAHLPAGSTHGCDSGMTQNMVGRLLVAAPAVSFFCKFFGRAA